jgi:hypothetical protein
MEQKLGLGPWQTDGSRDEIFKRYKRKNQNKIRDEKFNTLEDKLTTK